MYKKEKPTSATNDSTQTAAAFFGINDPRYQITDLAIASRYELATGHSQHNAIKRAATALKQHKTLLGKHTLDSYRVIFLDLTPQHKRLCCR